MAAAAALLLCGGGVLRVEQSVQHCPSALLLKCMTSRMGKTRGRGPPLWADSPAEAATVASSSAKRTARMVAEFVSLHLSELKQHEETSHRHTLAVEACARWKVLCGAGSLPSQLADCPGT